MHDLLSEVRQRLYALTLGYDNLNDHDRITQDLALQNAVRLNTATATVEKNVIVEVLYEDELEGGNVIARTSVKGTEGNELMFEGLIEDDGDCIDLLTPYDRRDGDFVNLDKCIYDMW